MALHRQHDQPSAPTRVRRKRGAQSHAIGRSRGGLSTKVHLIVDALGTPLCFAITEGQRHDCLSAVALLQKAQSKCLLGDKAYDSDSIRAAVVDQGGVAVIPPTRSRSRKVAYDKEIYKARSDIECSFSLLKQARRFATRYEKTLRNYTAVVALGCALIWLRV